MPAKKPHKPKHVPPKPRPQPKPKKKIAPRVTAVPKMLNVHLRIHFSLPNEPGKPAWPRKSRWQPEHSVPGATITVHGTGISVTTDEKGDAKLPIAGLTGARLLAIRPHKDWLNDAPAGPGHASTSYKDSPVYFFRPFDVTVVIEGGAFSLTAPPSVFSTPSPGGPPPHAALFDLTLTDLTLDWKPDWFKVRNTPNAEDPAPPPKDNDCLVLHQTSWPGKIGSVLNTFNNTKADASAHYIIDLDGHIVKTLHETWHGKHAGRSFWQGRLKVNAYSIGIEIVHTDVTEDGTAAPRDFTDAQYAALLRLVPEIRAAYPLITRQRVVGHSDVEIEGPDSAGTMHYRIGRNRAGDPGDRFDWVRLERAWMARQPLLWQRPATVYGIGPGQLLRPGATGLGVARLQADLALIGYSVHDADGTTPSGSYDVATQRAVQRFRIRYFSGSRLRQRPQAPSDGSLDFETAVAIRQVLADSGS